MQHHRTSRERLSSVSSSADTRDRRDSVDSAALASGRSRLPSGPQSSLATDQSASESERSKPSSASKGKTQVAGKSWLGGIFGKLLPKGPNQMILPDDKDPDVRACSVFGMTAIDIGIPDKLTIDAFVRADDNVVVYEEVTDEAIIERVREADDTEDQEEMHAKKPNPQVVLDALDTLRSFFCAHGDDVAMDHFFQCEGRALKLSAK
ncbi:hypothetical protein HPB51_021605 [Rhipicephalus microplus]|uniref:Uncharacterized protein n=1 Tax=Rhipicephalus microplus TaxID=6941 RepID=A0A9J6EIP3_RHIMP|nr:hypothetical protein HPB51_021605 [Rhipicephalus microplus]